MTAARPAIHGLDHWWASADPGRTPHTLLAVFDGSGSALTTGVKGDATITFPGVIRRWRLLADQSGSIVIDVWKTDYASFPPTVADTIAGSDLPTLSTAAKAESTALTGWDTIVVVGDTLRFNINSVTTVTRVTLALELACPH